ncbi:Vitamin B12 ABC transporter, permease component BtuC [Euzebya pacifica]|uniref:Vitamin B12 ABC transporter, permease component BtuC n=1 Tax=Euzebya pacifica TaxID=1608957 RepID=A0A346XXU7_9ACTN|nr:iron ABC transporter permease [Euzebya pacifica]AXV07044.1 Vitamin B12 ABC transporter, permease component BtuC [Euzebya pacifica]
MSPDPVAETASTAAPTLDPATPRVGPAGDPDRSLVTRSGPASPMDDAAPDRADGDVVDHHYPREEGRGTSRRPVVPILLGLLVLTAGLFAGALALGSVAIPVVEVWTVLTGGEPSTSSWSVIITDIRLPRAVTALVAGAGLSVAGLQLQTLFRNPLADPFVLGIASGASLGVALVSLAGSGSMFLGTLALGGSVSTAVAAAIGAGLVLGAVLTFARRIRSITSVLIIGLMAGYLAGSVVSLLLFFSDSDDFRAYLAWSLGSFRGVTWSELAVLVPAAVIGLLLAASTVKGLNALLLGERYAESVGVNVRAVRAAIIVSSSLLAGVITAFAGPIAFVGLAVPHLGRALLRTSDHRVLMPAVVLIGACVALGTEIIAGVPGQDLALPLNAVTPVLGAPVVIVVLMRLRRSAEVVLS